jgi:pimeloyl-[acyl-carrier protein] methyl ester esterase
MQKYFINNKSEKLIIIFNGWGMDEKPFLPFKNTSDILIMSNYSSVEKNSLNDFNFSKYSEISLIAYSAGVMMANYLQETLPKINYSVSVNGTFKIFDTELGVTEANQLEMRALNLDNVFEFRKKLITEESQLILFNKNQPWRTLESSMNELYALESYKLPNMALIFDKVLISSDDKIMCPKNQLRFWNGHKNIQNITGGHFPFYNFSSFNEIINF